MFCSIEACLVPLSPPVVFARVTHYPYTILLFFIEVLFRCINLGVMEDRIARIKLSRTCPTIHHLFFIDSIFLFGHVNLVEVNRLLDCVKQFCQWLGETVYLSKFSCFFNRNFLRHCERDL